MNKTPSQLRDDAKAQKAIAKQQKRSEWIRRELDGIRDGTPAAIRVAATEGESHYEIYTACFVNAVKPTQYRELGPDWEFKRDGSGTIVMDNLMAEVWKLCHSMASVWGVQIELHNHTNASPDKAFAEAHNYCICAVW